MIQKFVTWAQDFDYNHRVIAGIGIAVVFFTLFFMIGGDLVISHFQS